MHFSSENKSPTSEKQSIVQDAYRVCVCVCVDSLSLMRSTPNDEHSPRSHLTRRLLPCSTRKNEIGLFNANRFGSILFPRTDQNHEENYDFSATEIKFQWKYSRNVSIVESYLEIEFRKRNAEKVLCIAHRLHVFCLENARCACLLLLCMLQGPWTASNSYENDFRQYRKRTNS